MGKVLVMVDNGFEDAELLYPYYRFQEAGYKVDVVGHKAEEMYKGKFGVLIMSNLAPEDVNIDEYVAVIIPGGRAPDSMRTKKAMVDIVKKAFDKGKIVAGICHGPQMLIEADIVRGKRVTSYAAVVTDLKNAGGLFEDKSVIVDSNLVTSRVPSDLPDFCKAILKLLKKKPSASTFY